MPSVPLYKVCLLEFYGFSEGKESDIEGVKSSKNVDTRIVQLKFSKEFQEHPLSFSFSHQESQACQAQ